MENENAAASQAAEQAPEQPAAQAVEVTAATEQPAVEQPEKPIAIETLTEETLKDATIPQLEGLLNYLHNIGQTLRLKADLVHGVMEAKQRIEAEDKEARKANTPEDVDAKIAALNRRKEELSKPPTQHLFGDHITKDNDQVNPGNGKQE